MSNKSEQPVAKAQMMIRKPVAEVFQSLIDPRITSHFWFSKGAAPLQVGERVRWHWEMYGVHTIADVKAIDPDERILIEWNGPENPSFVEWTFRSIEDGQTFVPVRNWGFSGGAEEAINSTEGFTNLLAAMKFYLEHGIEPNLVLDHAPNARVI
ncbi:SRPBCC family protein [Mesorhizobium sp.]|uniref:SRPBCC family protein n=1 Tax=Mesorhizobium sp. TaxID=1871066 RepID=UPI000FEA3D75|nr:SRPBCC family protein [Mesorhizobium sp.]RWP81942.1 MAG: polyketide cyclase [Mesorhizobium sp.]